MDGDSADNFIPLNGVKPCSTSVSVDNDSNLDTIAEGLDADVENYMHQEESTEKPSENSSKLEKIIAEAERTNEDLPDQKSNNDCQTGDDDDGGDNDVSDIDEEALVDAEKTFTDEHLMDRHKRAVTLKNQGNEEYKSEEFDIAVLTYSEAASLCPMSFKRDRAIIYANRAACFMNQLHFKRAIRDCSKSIQLEPEYLKAIGRRAQAYEKSDKLDEALKDYQRVLELDRTHISAIYACRTLPDRINERNEKLKTEMFSKLKDLGNMVLRPFGLSTNNFQMQQTDGGGYNIQFVQNQKP